MSAETTIPAPAGTVVLLRDRPGPDIEVLMVRRGKRDGNREQKRRDPKGNLQGQQSEEQDVRIN